MTDRYMRYILDCGDEEVNKNAEYYARILQTLPLDSYLEKLTDVEPTSFVAKDLVDDDAVRIGFTSFNYERILDIISGEPIIAKYGSYSLIGLVLTILFQTYTESSSYSPLHYNYVVFYYCNRPLLILRNLNVIPLDSKEVDGEKFRFSRDNIEHSFQYKGFNIPTITPSFVLKLDLKDVQDIFMNQVSYMIRNHRSRLLESSVIELPSEERIGNNLWIVPLILGICVLGSALYLQWIARKDASKIVRISPY